MSHSADFKTMGRCFTCKGKYEHLSIINKIFSIGESKKQNNKMLFSVN